MSIYHDLEAIKLVAIEQTKEDGYNYNIILHNPNDKGEFDAGCGSTYEFVMDSYFDKPRRNAILMCKTKDLLKAKEIDETINSIEENKLTPKQETEKIIAHFTKVPEGYDKIREDMVRTDVAMKCDNKGDKLKKGLSAVEAKADGVNYKQGRAGLERIANTNRNSRCNCGSGKKFKKCCGK